MERQKKNLILLGITGFVFLLAFLANDPFLLFETSYEKSSPIISGNTDRVKKITVEDGTNKRIFTRTTDGWSAEFPGHAPGVLRADSAKIESGLKNLFEARRYQEVSSNKEKQSDYEVRDSDFSLVLEGENGAKIARIVLGKYAAQSSGSFVRLASDSSVYAVKGFLRNDWNQEFDQYRDRSILRVIKENIREIKVSGKSAFSLKGDDKGVFSLEPTRATDKARAETYLNDLTDLKGVGFYKEATLPPKFGTITLTLSSNVTKTVEFFGPTKNNEMVAQSSDAPQGLTLAKNKVEALFPRLEDLVDKGKLPNLAPPQ